MHDGRLDDGDTGRQGTITRPGRSTRLCTSARHLAARLHVVLGAAGRMATLDRSTPLGCCGQSGQMRLYGSFQIGEQGAEAVEINLCRVGSHYGFGENLLSVVGTGIKSVLVVKCLAVKYGGLDAWLKEIFDLRGLRSAKHGCRHRVKILKDMHKRLSPGKCWASRALNVVFDALRSGIVIIESDECVLSAGTFELFRFALIGNYEIE